MKTHKLTLLALLTTLSLILFIVESFIPPIVPIPGIKLGLANIITLFVLTQGNIKDASMVLLARIVLSSVFAGQGVYFLYSIAGGVCCLLSMSVMNWFLRKHFLYLTSIVGALFHNLGQVGAACLLLQTTSLAAYLPVLFLSGMVTGLFTGLCTHFLNKHFHLLASSN